MKKILALIVMSLLLTSCFGKIEETPVNDDTKTVIEDTINDDTNTNNTIPIIEDDKKDDSDVVPVVDDNNTITDDTTTETNSADEEILEDEVNALLDEFIDSLDNYDK